MAVHSSIDGFLNFDADEIYCKTLSGQCNIYSLHAVTNCDGHDFILVITLSGKLYQFSINHGGGSNLPRIRCNEFDLRNHFPSHYVDLEVVCSCILQRQTETYLFLACVDDDRSHLDGGRTASGSGSAPAPGMIFILRIAPPSPPSVVLTLTTSYSPSFINVIPLRKAADDEDAGHVLLVSGNDRSLHGYRLENRDKILTCECFLGEAFTEFDAYFRRGGSLGTALQIDTGYRQTERFERFMALGFDSGFMAIFHADASRNELIRIPVEKHSDTPISALKLLPTPILDTSTPPERIGIQFSLLVCPGVGPAYLHVNIGESNWTDGTSLPLSRSDQFDCITYAETVMDSEGFVDFILMGTFGGKALIYSFDQERSLATLLRTHSFLSPVMSMKILAHKYLAVLLTCTIMIFEL